jgi:hypothetical protein
MSSMRNLLPLLGTATAMFVAVFMFFYPAAFTLGMTRDPGIRATGQPTALPSWFERTSRRYSRWARQYLATQSATRVGPEDVAGTEWPIFGSVFFVLTTEELVKSGRVRLDGGLRTGLERAAGVISHPSTATWVRRRWGADYLERENVFYRMLLILGLSTYERITGDVRYHALTVVQAAKLGGELADAEHHLRDDYPNECYPSDVLWAVVAVQRAEALEGKDGGDLSNDLLAVLDGQVKTEHGLPAFRVDSRTAQILQPARGCANSGILNLTGELDPVVADRWYASYVEHYWVDGWVKGFREMPPGMETFCDVDSGPVVFGIGSVASAFGIGAARAVGHHDHAARLSMEAVAASWPSPFGPLLPGVVSLVAADGWCFGEIAMYFAMTRPNYSGHLVLHDGSVPPFIWLCSLLYFAGGALIAAREWQYWRKRLRRARG